MSSKNGFSLVELMIVVAIIGILAAIAIPNFVDMQLKAKRAELPPNVNGIKTAQIAHNAALDAYTSASPSPRMLAGDESGKVAVPWPSPAPTDWVAGDGNGSHIYASSTQGASVSPEFGSCSCVSVS